MTTIEDLIQLNLNILPNHSVTFCKARLWPRLQSSLSKLSREGGQVSLMVQRPLLNHASFLGKGYRASFNPRLKGRSNHLSEKEIFYHDHNHVLISYLSKDSWGIKD